MPGEEQEGGNGDMTQREEITTTRSQTVHTKVEQQSFQQVRHQTRHHAAAKRKVTHHKPLFEQVGLVQSPKNTRGSPSPKNMGRRQVDHARLMQNSKTKKFIKEQRKASASLTPLPIGPNAPRTLQDQGAVTLYQPIAGASPHNADHSVVVLAPPEELEEGEHEAAREAPKLNTYTVITAEVSPQAGFHSPAYGEPGMTEQLNMSATGGVSTSTRSNSTLQKQQEEQAVVDKDKKHLRKIFMNQKESVFTAPDGHNMNKHSTVVKLLGQAGYQVQVNKDGEFKLKEEQPKYYESLYGYANRMCDSNDQSPFMEMKREKMRV